MALSIVESATNNDVPDGSPLTLSKYVTMSRYSSGVIDPGLSSGIVVRISSYKSLAVRPFHFFRKSGLVTSFFS